MKAVAVSAVRAYQRYISPMLPKACRFEPTCSEYARQAIVRYGFVRGVGMGFIRLMKCHPFHPGGYDPVR